MTARRIALLITLGAAAVFGMAASGGSFSVDWSALVPGARSQQSVYVLESAIGQATASSSQAGVYTVQSGYLVQPVAAQSSAGKQWIQYR